MSKKILSDEEIINGFRNGNPRIIHDYFYENCLAGYHIYNQRYQLQGKENLDFYSLAHQYALYLISHNWKPLENHSPGVSLRTWIINGFRYTVLDALKWHQKAYSDIPVKDYVESSNTNDSLRHEFNQMIEEICEYAPLTDQERTIIEMNLLQGYKVKEIAETLHVTPSAVSQKLKHLKEGLIVPYFHKYFKPEMEESLEAIACEDRTYEEPLLESFSYKGAIEPSSSFFNEEIQYYIESTDSDQDWTNETEKLHEEKIQVLPPIWEQILRGEYEETT